MAQYDDPRNPFSSTPGRPEAGSPWGDSQPSSGGGRGGLQLPGEASGAWGNDGFNRPSAGTRPVARRRNQWRQHQQLTPDFGTTPPDEPDLAKAPAPRNASLPTFKHGPVSLPSPASAPTHRPTPQGQPAPLRGFAASGASLQMHPHNFQPGSLPVHRPQAQATQALGLQTQTGAAGGLPPNVTPLRPLNRRSKAGSMGSSPAVGPAAAVAARSLVPDSAGVTEGAIAARRPSRASATRRRLANPPLPLLYLIRLIILGVGVAAIAGTLLSVLSPANVASSRDGTAPAAQAQGTAKTSGALVEGATASTIADLRLTSEITHLKGELEQLVPLTPGLTAAAFAVDLDSGQYVDLGGAEPVAAASTIKVPILVAFLQQVDAGTIALNQSLMLQEEYIAGGSGTMRSEAVGNEYTALEVATRMIVASDNTATNMMIAALGGIEALNQTFAGWGLGATLLRNPLPDLEGTNMTSAKDLALIMALVDQGGVLTPRSRDRLFSIMQRTENSSLIPSGIDDQSLTAHKTGDIGTMLGDVALVDVPNGRRYALALMVQRPTNDGRASELIRRMTGVIHQEMAQPLAPAGTPNATSAPLSPPGEFEPQGEIQPPGEFTSPEGEPGIPVTPVPVEVPPPPDRAPARDEVPPG